MIQMTQIYAKGLQPKSISVACDMHPNEMKILKPRISACECHKGKISKKKKKKTEYIIGDLIIASLKKCTKSLTCSKKISLTRH